MKIRLEIVGTEPAVREGTYVYNSGELEGLGVQDVLSSLEGFVLRSLKDLRRLRVTEDLGSRVTLRTDGPPWPGTNG